MITDDELAEWQRLCDAATPGPWRLDGRHDYDDGSEFGIDMIVANNGEPVVIADSGVYPPHGQDAEFIAAARSAIPRLLEEVRRLRAEVWAGWRQRTRSCTCGGAGMGHTSECNAYVPGDDP